MKFITVDVETAPIVNSDTVDAHNMLVYDIGWIVSNGKGTDVLVERSFIVEEIFLGQFDKMRSAYYSDKIPMYIRDIADGKRKILPMQEIRKIFNDDIKEYKCKAICAYNAYFDYTALNTTMKFLFGEHNYFTACKMEWWDTMKMATDTIYKMKSYKKFCLQNGYVTAKGNVKRTAESFYRFITKNTAFNESHTGLEDVKIELEIYKACKAKHKKMRKKLFND